MTLLGCVPVAFLPFSESIWGRMMQPKIPFALFQNANSTFNTHSSNEAQYLHRKLVPRVAKLPTVPSLRPPATRSGRLRCDWKLVAACQQNVANCRFWILRVKWSVKHGIWKSYVPIKCTLQKWIFFASYFGHNTSCQKLPNWRVDGS